MKALTTLLVVGMFATAVAMADDADDVKAALLDRFDALNSGDVDRYVKYHSQERSVFLPTGELLDTSSFEERRNNRQSQVNAGFVRNFQARHLEVKVYGETALVTGYLVGSQTFPNGTTQQIGLRRSAVWLKQGGQWKEIHAHLSPMRLPQ